jgi:hypothetical protein
MAGGRAGACDRGTDRGGRVTGACDRGTDRGTCDTIYVPLSHLNAG